MQSHNSCERPVCRRPLLCSSARREKGVGGERGGGKRKEGEGERRGEEGGGRGPVDRDLPTLK